MLHLPEEPLLSYSYPLTPDDNERQDVQVLLHRLVLGRPEVDVFDAILPCMSTILGLDEAPIMAKRPIISSGTPKLSRQITSALAVRSLCANKTHAVVNGKNAPWGDALIILELVAEVFGCNHIALIVQSKRKESKEERGRTDLELFDDYMKTIWAHRSEYREQKIFPVFIYLTDALSVYEGDEGKIFLCL